ncbi:TPA_asm: P overlapped [Pelargonium alphacytorhabdovirus 1]|nr:TPA_asm: P overlapped [Pelargonium alphacytorhabdovirus 1]
MHTLEIDFGSLLSWTFFIIQGLWLLVVKLAMMAPYWISVPCLSLCFLTVWSMMMTLWRILTMISHLFRVLLWLVRLVYRLAVHR